MRGWRRAALALLVAGALALAGCGGEPLVDATITVDGNSAHLKVETRNIKVGTGARDNHVHFYLDGGPQIMMYSAAYTFQNLTPGKHTVKVEVSDAKHVLIPGLVKTLDFEIK